MTTSTGSSSRRRSAPDPAFRTPSDPRAIEEALERLELRPSRRWGQSFLIDPFVADAEAALAVDGRTGPIVEIGGGLGVLTEALLRRGARPLTVVEHDSRLVGHLRATFGDEVRVVEAAALTYRFPAGATVVGNLPFSTATPILLALWAARLPRIVVMVQREVAERIAATPGSKKYGRLSILAALYGTTELFQSVPSRSFRPVPEVEGRLLVFRAREGDLPVPSVPRFEELVRGLFSSRRKQLGNLLPRLAGSEPAAERWASGARWPSTWSTARPEDLPPEAYFALSRIATSDPVRV